MKLVDKKVLHGTFGKGNVISCDSDYIEVDFEEEGVKKFVYPDVFGEYMSLTDTKTFNLIKEKIQKQDEERESEAKRLRQERALEEERRQVLEQRRNVKTVRIHPEIQSVFWAKAGEEEEIFTDWKVFVGKIKNGDRKGQARRLARMTGNSACLITKRESDDQETKRQILGVFLSEENFKGTTEDGYIQAHPDYRIQLSEEESQKMLFWNYYINKKFPKRQTWNSGRQRYFDNIWMAQILRDIVTLREGKEEQAEAESFFKHFCKINRINPEELEEAAGALAI